MESMPGIAGARKSERLRRDFGERDTRTVGKRVPRADHKAETVSVNVVNLQVRRLHRQRYDSDIDGAIFDALQDLVAEIALNAALHYRLPALTFPDPPAPQQHPT